MSLQGRTALVTGGAKNLGALVASTLAAEGANIAIHYHGDAAAKSAKALVASIQQKHPHIKVSSHQADLTVQANVKQVFADALQELGSLDIVVNTAGMVLKKALIDVSEQEFDTMIATNTKAAFLVSQEAAKTIKEGGSIINLVTSLLGAYTPFYSVYQGAKAPVEWFTKGLSKELMSRSISVNAVAPGPMDTPFLYGQEDDAAVAYLKSVAIDGRLTKIEDIAPLIKFLVTEGRWITGKCLCLLSRRISGY